MRLSPVAATIAVLCCEPGQSQCLPLQVAIRMRRIHSVSQRVGTVRGFVTRPV